MTTPETPDRVTDSGTATASDGGIANSGYMRDVKINHHHYPVTATPDWPVCVGTVPPLASAFQPRAGLRERILETRGAGSGVVLGQKDRAGPGALVPAQRGHAARVLAGGGGVGKSQLAAWFTHHAVREQDTDLILWVPASGPDQIITAYARAARRVGAPGALGTDENADATAFLEWLLTTARTWLVVLDDVTDAAHLAGWWPPARAGGWTLATTRLQAAEIISAGRQKIDIDVYDEDESIAYLTDRLTEAGLAGCLDETVPALAGALGHLPLALSHAAAYLINQAEPCRTYLNRYLDGSQRLTDLMPAGNDPDEYGRPVAVTLLVTLEAADATAPAGLARPALVLAALLDPAGHPDGLWTTEAVAEYLTSSAGRPVTAGESRQTLRLLHRYGLVNHTAGGSAREVRLHALTARAARESAGDVAVAGAAGAAADALMEIWPENDYAVTDLTTSLRSNAITLNAIPGDLLWDERPHPLIDRAGKSLLDAGLFRLAVDYWHGIAEHSEQRYGDQDAATALARIRRTLAYWQDGRAQEAVALQERVLADRERLLGDRHPATIKARADLAASYGYNNRTEDAIVLRERVLADREQLLGDRHPDTVKARADLAISYRYDGRLDEAIELNERVVTDRTDLFGDKHRDTITARSDLATSYRVADRFDEAIELHAQALTDRIELLGGEHPSVIAARVDLAFSYQVGGRPHDAVELDERILADSRQAFGDKHPDTIAARSRLAGSYRAAERLHDAIPLQERVLADRADLLGDKHPDTITARIYLASSYWAADRLHEAIALQERVLADRADLLGAEHPDTIAARPTLAFLYRRDGRVSEATELLRRAFAEAERVLGSAHPRTMSIARVLAAWSPTD